MTQDFEIKDNEVVIKKDEEPVGEKKKLRSLSDGKEHLDWLKDVEGVDLEIEVDKCYENNTFPSVGWSTLDNIAKHFANWQKKQMMKSAVIGEVTTPASSYFLQVRYKLPKDTILKLHDKVKLIIVKEE